MGPIWGLCRCTIWRVHAAQETSRMLLTRPTPLQDYMGSTFQRLACRKQSAGSRMGYPACSTGLSCWSRWRFFLKAGRCRITFPTCKALQEGRTWKPFAARPGLLWWTNHSGPKPSSMWCRNWRIFWLEMKVFVETTGICFIVHCSAWDPIPPMDAILSLAFSFIFWTSTTQILAMKHLGAECALGFCHVFFTTRRFFFGLLVVANTWSKFADGHMSQGAACSSLRKLQEEALGGTKDDRKLAIKLLQYKAFEAPCGQAILLAVFFCALRLWETDVQQLLIPKYFIQIQFVELDTPTVPAKVLKTSVAAWWFSVRPSVRCCQRFEVISPQHCQRKQLIPSLFGVCAVSQRLPTVERATPKYIFYPQTWSVWEKSCKLKYCGQLHLMTAASWLAVTMMMRIILSCKHFLTLTSCIGNAPSTQLTASNGQEVLPLALPYQVSHL